MWAVVAALALVFYMLVRAGTDVPPKTTCDEEPPAGLTKQQLAMLEAGDKPSTGEKPSPPSSTTTWSEIAPPSVSSAESWAEVEAVATAAELSLEERTAFSHNMWRIKQEELGVLVDKLMRMCPAAIEEENKDEIEINIDKIDARTFRELDNYVNECLAGKPRARPYGPKGTMANPLDMMQ